MDITCFSKRADSSPTISIRYGNIPPDIEDMLYERYTSNEMISIEELEFN